MQTCLTDMLMFAITLSFNTQHPHTRLTGSQTVGIRQSLAQSIHSI